MNVRRKPTENIDNCKATVWCFCFSEAYFFYKVYCAFTMCESDIWTRSVYYVFLWRRSRRKCILVFDTS
ncbi:hypothetical protein C0J52_12429 [Blattella germanica]|nr:hypothetical protein C0J52_12429 [Blattella germanica]